MLCDGYRQKIAANKGDAGLLKVSAQLEETIERIGPATQAMTAASVNAPDCCSVTIPRLRPTVNVGMTKVMAVVAKTCLLNAFCGLNRCRKTGMRPILVMKKPMSTNGIKERLLGSATKAFKSRFALVTMKKIGNEEAIT